MNRGRRRDGYRRRRADAIKRAAAAHIAMITGDDSYLRPDAGEERGREH